MLRRRIGRFVVRPDADVAPHVAPQRLLFVSHSFAPVDEPLANVGGMQRVAMELADALSARADVQLELHVLRAPWKRIGLYAPVFLAGLPARLLARARRGDIVLFSSVTTALGALPVFAALRRRGVRVAAIAHGLDVTEPHPAYQVVVRAVLSRLDVVLPVSRSTATFCSERGAKNVVVVPNGVDLARFESLAIERRERPRRAPRAEVRDDDFVLLGVGRQVRRKGFGWFVENVLPGLPKRFRLVLVGDGPERSAIERSAREHRVEDRLILTGLAPESELLAWFRRADAMIMPNVEIPGDVEGFGIVLLEAAASSVPAVAARLEGITDVVVDGETGLLVKSGDAAAWIESLSRLGSEPSRLQALGEAARIRAVSRFDWTGVAARYLEALR